MDRYRFDWRRLDLKDDPWVIGKYLMPFGVCVIVARMIRRISNGPVQIRITDMMKGERK